MPFSPDVRRYVYQPGRRVVNVGDARLTGVLVRGFPVCASLDEYAAATGIPVDELVQLLEGHLGDNSLALEVAGDEVFLLTAPHGRPVPPECADVAPNLWEHLRRHAGPERAFELWRLFRGLERSGWRVEAQAERIVEGMSRMAFPPQLGVYVGQRAVPLILFPLVDELRSTGGLLTSYEQAGAAMVGVVCEEGALDAAVTASRKWILAHRRVLASLSILVLEAPRFLPVLLSGIDAAVAPVALTHATIQEYVWPDGRRGEFSL